MEIKKAYLAMIREYPGGWDAMAAALGMTRDALENRIYERKGQSVLTETALQMQQFSSSTHFAEAVAQVSGGADTPENLAACCKPCNLSKGPKTPEEWRGKL